MAEAKMTLWGIERFLNSDNKSILDLLNLPTGMDKATLLNSILLDAGEFPAVYSDPDFIRAAVGAWGLKYADTIARWWEVWKMKYNPLHNYDRTETVNDTENGISSGFNQNGKTVNELGQTSASTATDGTEEYKKSAYDDSDYSPKDKRINNVETDTTGMDSRNTSEREKADDTRFNSRSNTHRARMFGNIGTTKTTEMAIDEDDFRKDYNPYKLVTDLFLVDFCVMIY